MLDNERTIRPLRILYIGQLAKGATSLHRKNALESLGHQVAVIDTSVYLRLRSPVLKRVSASLLHRLGKFIDCQGINSKMLRLGRLQKYDLIWVDKTTIVRPETIRQLKRILPACRIVNYSPDDMFNPANQSPFYRQCLTVYDAFITTKSFNVSEFYAAGAKKVLFVDNAYEPSVHRPTTPSTDQMRRYGADIGFIGAWEKERASSIRKLVDSGFSICLAGGRWESFAIGHAPVKSSNAFLPDSEYAAALSCCKINLGFLRKVNRDLQTQRSVEIPACGGFMLAERTEEHLRLFKEGKEAEFFSSDEELIQKADYYLKNPDQRRAIAAAGLKRCQTAGYSNANRISEVIRNLGF